MPFLEEALWRSGNILQLKDWKQILLFLYFVGGQVFCWEQFMVLLNLFTGVTLRMEWLRRMLTRTQ